VASFAERFVRKVFQALPVGVSLLLGLVVACAPSGAAPGAPAATPAGNAAGAGKPTTLAQLAVYQGSDRQQVLEEGAKQEGKLTWYTSLAGPIIDRLFDGYKAKYPYVATEVFRGDGSALITKASQEAQAGQDTMDVMESPQSTVRLLWEAGLMTPYYSPSVASYPDGMKTPSSQGNGLIESATVRIQLIGFGYNTTLIPESAVPKTLDDLMNPALADKLALAGSATGTRWAGSVLHQKGEDQGKQWLNDFAAKQNPSVQQISGKALMDLVAKGEVPASPTVYKAELEQLVKDQGAPVKWVGLDPVVGNEGQAVLPAKAPHPHAALLFIDYLLGDGQQIMQDNYYNTATQPVPFQIWLPDQGKTAAQMEASDKLWTDVFKASFRN
jgi:iron(III) transport system substrate-binding protein